MEGNCVYGEHCADSVHPSLSQKFPYDDISYEIDNNIIGIRAPKVMYGEQTIDEIDHDSTPTPDSAGEKCKDTSTKLNIILNKIPPRKMPNEETLSLKIARQTTDTGYLKNTLEIEFKGPSNYIPLPSPGPPTLLIVPEMHSNDNKVEKKRKPTGKGKKKK